MNGLILCAGLGTRLRPITNKIPKPMVKVAGYPVLEHLVFHLHKYGIKKVVVNIHYKPEVIMDYFGTRLLYFYEPKLLGESRTIEALSNWLADDYTVVMNGDTLTNIDIRKMLELSGGENIKSMEGKVYTGTKILTPTYFEGHRKFNEYFDASLYWQDMGTPEGLKEARKYYEKFSYLPKV